MANVKIVAPDGDSEGHLQRQQDTYRLQLNMIKARNLAERAEAEKDTGLLEQAFELLLKSSESVVDYLLPYVVEPKDKDAARAALLLLSENEYNAALEKARGEPAEDDSENPTE